MIHQERFSMETTGRGLYELSAQIQEKVGASGIRMGLCHLYLHHTSAALILCENADPSVRTDLESFFQRLVRDGDPVFTHRNEGPDDMSAHIRTILTGMTLSLPITEGRCALGTWQGIFLYEHRSGTHQRRLTLTLNGE